MYIFSIRFDAGSQVSWHSRPDYVLIALPPLVSSKFACDLCGMSEVQQERRQLTIKTGVAQRYVYIRKRKKLMHGSLAKELGVYRQEADEQAARVKQYAAQGKDEWDVKKQVCVPLICPFQ